MLLGKHIDNVGHFTIEEIKFNIDNDDKEYNSFFINGGNYTTEDIMKLLNEKVQYIYIQPMTKIVYT